MTKTFWLLFCDPYRPKGQQFLGVAVVEVSSEFVAYILPELKRRFPNHVEGAEWIAAATRMAWLMGCNPGGEVGSLEVPDDALALPEFQRTPRYQLLSKKELQDLGHIDSKG